MNTLNDKAHKLADLFTAELKGRGCVIFIGYLVLTAVLEILSYRLKGVFSAITVRLWLFTGALCFLAFLIMAFKNLCRDIKAKSWLNIVGILLPVILLFFFIGDVVFSDINADAAQQAAAGLDAFNEPDFNYTGKAFLGYACRQYLISAIPALIAGRTIGTLQLGFAYPFIIGLVFLFFELREWNKKEGLPEHYALFPVYSILAFRFISEYYMNFEQAITPVALTMLALALFIRLYIKPDAITVIGLGWTINLMCNSYTPVIASLGLLAAAFGLLIILLCTSCFKRNGISLKSIDRASLQKILMLIAMLGYTGLVFLSTTLGERADRLTSFREDSSVSDVALESWKEFFTDTNAHFLGIFAGIIILYMLLSLLGRFTFWDFMVSCWVLGVVFFSNYLVGYTAYQKEWILQRNMIIIPVLCSSIYIALMRFIKQKSLTLKTIPTVILLCTGLLISIFNFYQPHQSFTYFRYIQPVKYMYSYMEDTLKEENLKATDKFSVVLYTDNVLESNIYDYAKFFYPNAEVWSETYEECNPYPEFEGPAFLFSQDGCIGPFAYEDCEQRTFFNSRYNSEITWYRIQK